MPIYEYRCDNGHTTEVIDIKREFVNTPSLVCSQCGLVAAKCASASNWQLGSGPKESFVSGAIKRVKRAEAMGKIR